MKYIIGKVGFFDKPPIIKKNSPHFNSNYIVNVDMYNGCILYYLSSCNRLLYLEYGEII